MTNLPLTRIGETATTITFGWAPVPGCVGYRFSRSAAPGKFSVSWSPAKSSVTFSKDSAAYYVEALGTAAVGRYPSASVSPSSSASPSVSPSASKSASPSASPSAPPVGNEIYRCDFANHDWSQTISGNQDSLNANPGHIYLVDAPPLGLPGKYAARCETYPEPWVAYTSHRAEVNIQALSPHLGGGSLEGKEVLVEMHWILDPAFPKAASWFVVPMQFNGGVNSPVFAIEQWTDERMKMVTRGGRMDPKTGGDSNAGYKAADLCPVQRGVPRKLRAEVRFSTDPAKGRAVVWVDDAPESQPTGVIVGATLATEKPAAPFMKVGWYAGWGPAQGPGLAVTGIRWEA